MPKFAILQVTPHILVDFCKHGTDKVRIIENAIPEDAKIVRVFINDFYSRGIINIVLESEHWRELREDEEIPILPNPIFMKVYDA